MRGEIDEEKFSVVLQSGLGVAPKEGSPQKMDNSCIKGSIESGKWEVTLTVITLFEITLIGTRVYHLIP
jgi:hypothetical protein